MNGDGPGSVRGSPALLDLLLESRDLGFLGPGPVEDHIEHALALGQVVTPPRCFADLGSGGGVPGLVLAEVWPDSRAVLVEAGQRRCQFLRRASLALGASERIAIACERAEVTARGHWRGRCDLVVSRGFGPPAVTAECAVGLLAPGGHLVVSEPPGGDAHRWPDDGLAQLGFERVEIRTEGGRSFAIIGLPVGGGPASDKWPRRAGIPTKRPLWSAPGE